MFEPEVTVRIGILVAAVFAVLALTPALGAQNCRITAVDPGSGKIGDVVGAAGESVDKAKVEELYLTDGTNDIKVQIIEQSDSMIKFKIPTKIKPGRYSLMIKTKGPDAKLLEQPVRFTVDET